MKSLKVWDMHKTQTILTWQICSLLPFLHALTGCDTTSQIFGVGQTSALKIFRKNKTFQEIASRFVVSQTKDEIIELGEKAVLSVLEGDLNSTLNAERFKRFSSQVLRSTTVVQVQSLPPTSSAAIFHSLRVYFQVQNLTSTAILQPEEWGWEVSDGVLVPIKTQLSATPEYL